MLWELRGGRSWRLQRASAVMTSKRGLSMNRAAREARKHNRGWGSTSRLVLHNRPLSWTAVLVSPLTWGWALAWLGLVPSAHGGAGRVIGPCLCLWPPPPPALRKTAPLSDIEL